MENHDPCDAPHREGRKRSVLPEKYEQCPASLRVRRSLTISRPEGSGVTLPARLRGPCPAANRWPETTLVTAASGPCVSRLPQLPSRPLVWQAVVPQKPSAPSLMQTVASSRMRPPLVAVRTMGPRWSKVKSTSPLTSVSSCFPPPPTIAEFDGALLARGDGPEKSLVYSSTWAVKGTPGRAVAGAVMSRGSPSKQPVVAPPHAAARRISSPSCGVTPQMPVEAGTLLT